MNRHQETDICKNEIIIVKRINQIMTYHSIVLVMKQHNDISLQSIWL